MTDRLVFDWEVFHGLCDCGGMYPVSTGHGADCVVWAIARIAQAKFDAWLEAQRVVYSLKHPPMFNSAWWEDRDKAAGGIEPSHRARLVAIERLEGE